MNTLYSTQMQRREEILILCKTLSLSLPLSLSLSLSLSRCMDVSFCIDICNHSTPAPYLLFSFPHSTLLLPKQAVLLFPSAVLFLRIPPLHGRQPFPPHSSVLGCHHGLAHLRKSRELCTKRRRTLYTQQPPVKHVVVKFTMCVFRGHLTLSPLAMTVKHSHIALPPPPQPVVCILVGLLGGWTRVHSLSARSTWA